MTEAQTLYEAAAILRGNGFDEHAKAVESLSTRPLTGGVTPEQIELGKQAYTDWQQGRYPATCSLPEAIYLAMSNVSRGVK